jgi:hypothetical protein
MFVNILLWFVIRAVTHTGSYASFLLRWAPVPRPTEGLRECVRVRATQHHERARGPSGANRRSIHAHEDMPRMSAAHSLILAATRIHTPTTASRGCFFTRVGSRVRTGGDGTERRDAAVTWCIGAASSGVKFQWPRINPQRNHTTGTQQQSRGVRGLRFGGSPGAPRAVARCTSSGQRALVTGLF